MIADSVHFFGDEEQKAGAVGGLHLFEAMGSLRVKAFELGSGAMVARYIYIYRVEGPCLEHCLKRFEHKS